MSKQEYDQAEDQGNILSNALYIVSGDYVDHLEDAAGNRISANLCCIAAGSQTPSMIATLDQLSAIDEKVTVIDRISGITDQPNLSIIKLSAEEYEDLVYDGGILSNAIYIIDQEYLDQYGQQIKNLGAPTDLSDAATKQYVDNSIGSIQIPTDLSDFTNSPGYLVLSALPYTLVNAVLNSCTYNNTQCVSCQIEDRTITTLSVDGNTPDVVVFLPQKQNATAARDFILRVEISAATVPGFTFVGAGNETVQYDSEDDEWYVLEPGLNLISFTETK